MDIDECIMCKNSLEMYPTMKLFTSPCSHKYCESCLNIVYMRTQVIECMGCGTQVRRRAFIAADGTDNKENSTRKKVLGIFNKRREDFKSLFEYNNYLEQAEDIIFDILQGGEQQTLAQQRMEDYKRQNQQSILVNKAKTEEEAMRVAAAIEEEERLMIEKRNYYRQQDLMDHNTKIKESLKAIDDLASGKISAKDIKELTKKNENNDGDTDTHHLTFTESKKLEMEQQEKNQQMELIKMQQQQQQQSNQSNQQQQQSGNKFNYQVTNKQQQQQAQPVPIAQPHSIDNQQYKPVFSQPTEQFKYDEISLKSVIPTQQQSDAAGFKQIFIKQRAFQEAFGWM